MIFATGFTLFWFVFLFILTMCRLMHVPWLIGMIVAGIGAGLFVWLSRSWWQRAFLPVKRPKESFRDPSLGNRAARREAARHHRKR